jgi:hypothetical protein
MEPETEETRGWRRGTSGNAWVGIVLVLLLFLVRQEEITEREKD